MVQNNFCSTCTICDMGQPPHPSGQVTFACHLPRDKFCKKYLSDPDNVCYSQDKSDSENELDDTIGPLGRGRLTQFLHASL